MGAASLMTLAEATGEPASTVEGAAMIGWIEIAIEDGSATLIARVGALAAGEAEASLAVCRLGRGGRMATRQGGSVQLAPGETATVARAGMNLAAGDGLEATLTVVVDGVTVAEARIRHGMEGEDTPCA